MANAENTPLAQHIVHIWTGEATRQTIFEDRIEIEYRPDADSAWGPTYELPKEGPPA